MVMTWMGMWVCTKVNLIVLVYRVQRGHDWSMSYKIYFSVEGIPYGESVIYLGVSLWPEIRVGLPPRRTMKV